MPSESRPRRAAGTRTFLDSLRHFFRPPTAAQRDADIEYLSAGGHLLVAATLMSDGRGDVDTLPTGRLLLASDTVTSTGFRGHADASFERSHWTVRTQARRGHATNFSVVSVVNIDDRGLHHEFRIPTSDVGLVVAALAST